MPLPWTEIRDHARKKSFASDGERAAFPFQLYQKFTNLPPDDGKTRRKIQSAKSK